MASSRSPIAVSALPEPAIYRVPSGRRVRGTVAVPPSKSAAQRALALILLAREPGEIVLRRPGSSEDVGAFLAALGACGLAVTSLGDDAGSVRIARPPDLPPPTVDIDCGAGGTMLRFLTAVLGAIPGRFRLDGIPRLRERPLGPLIEALRQLGAELRCLEVEGHAPLEITGGSLRGGRARLDAGASSQFLSALLLASLAAREPVTVEVTALTSAPYVDLTLDAMAGFGADLRRPAPGRFEVRPGLVRPAELTVEADDSSAAYPAAAAVLTGGEVRLRGLRRDSRQGDRAFLELLAAMGATLRWEGEDLTVTADGVLAAVDADLQAMPDQVPTLAAVAPFAEGLTRIRNVPHLRLKESDRLSAMARELGRLGVPVRELADGLEIPGVWAGASPPADPVAVDSWGDHRIAMSLALVGLRRPGVTVRDPGVAAKSYPGFWRDLEALIEG